MTDDARALLEGCVAALERGPWALVLPDDVLTFDAGIAGDVQWWRMTDAQGDVRQGVVLRGDDAWVRGSFVSAVLGHHVSPVRVMAVLDGRWLRCSRRLLLSRGPDAGPLAQVTKMLLQDDVPPRIVGVEERVPGPGRVVRIATLAGDEVTWAVATAGPRLVPDAARGEVYEYGDAVEPVVDPDALPAVDRGTVVEQFAAQRRQRRPLRRTVHVLVEEPASGADDWCVRSDDLAEALGVVSAVDAESLVLDALLAADADLRVDLDSSGDEFFAHAADRAGVDAVLAALATLGLSVETAPG